MPAPSLPAVDGVDAVVGDDVEAVLAMHDVGHEPVIDDEGANPKRLCRRDSWSASPAAGLLLVVERHAR